jgi:hypothetical protein
MKKILYSEVVEDNKNGLIIEDFNLPEGKFNVSSIRLLIFIPSKYNDTSPDMFYCYPKVVYAVTGKEISGTSGIIEFNKISWQQWSRHLNTGNDWRSGIDGIESYLQKVKHAFKIA